MKKIWHLIMALLLCMIPIQAVYADSNVNSLINSAASGDLEQVRILVKMGVDVNAKDKDGRTALMGASLWGHLEVVKYLIANGANANVSDNYGNTALMNAASGVHFARGGHLEIVKYLIAKGADINAKDKSGKTALMWALIDNQLEVANI